MATGFAIPPIPRTDWGARDERAYSRIMADGDPYNHDPRQRIARDMHEDRYEDRDAREMRDHYRKLNETNQRHAALGKNMPRMPWDKFLQELDWRAGEHFAMIGPTGQGKTTMLINILPQHQFTTVFATKPRDSSMSQLILQDGYIKVDRWRALDASIYPRRVLWPDASSLDSEPRQKEVFHDAFARIYHEGGWTVALDELWYIINVLKLERDVKAYLLQARSLGISLVCATQRPAFVPLEVYDQSTHLMFWRDNDRTNLDRISGLASNHARLVRDTVSNLDQYQVLYINTRTGRMLRTRCPQV